MTSGIGGSGRAWGVAATGIVIIALEVATVGLSVRGGATFDAVFSASFLAFAATGLLIVWRRPGNTIGRLLLVLGTTGPLGAFAAGYAGIGGLPGREWVAWASSIAFPVVFGTMLIYLPLLFPDGRFLSRRWGWYGLAAGAIVLMAALAFAFGPGPLDCCPEIENPLGVEALGGFSDAFLRTGFLALGVFAAGALVSVVLRYRRSRGDQRQQMKWFVFAVGFLVLVSLGGGVAGLLGIEGGASDVVPVVTFPTASTLLAVAVGIAVLKYRLYDIDIVINKALVYGALAAFITLLYVGVVVGIGNAVGAGQESNLGLQIAATALVAILFQPVRSRVQHLANRLVYGARSTPYEVMAEFGERMGGSLQVEEVLPQVAEAAARGVGAVAARVRVELEGAEAREARWPEEDGPEGTERVLTVTHRGEPVGEIAVTKAPGDPPRPQDEALLEDLAAQAGLALYNVRLAEELRGRVEQISRQAEELRASQQRIVTAADDARRLLERTIEDRVERRIEDLAERLRASTRLIDEDPDRGAAALEEAGVRAQATLEELREIARGIYPPLLADKGLAAALDAQARRGGDALRLRADGLGRYGQEIEAGVYFCCLEAMQQGALAIDVREEEAAVRFAIELEDGLGGERLVRIADRVEALGGELVVSDAGAVISATIPVDAATVPT